MTTIDTATVGDLERLVALEGGLFREDAGVYERFADVTWPDRDGRADFQRLLADAEGSLVLVARIGDQIVGMLVGYVTASSPTRQPVTHAVLRSMYVDSEHRRTGVGRQLVDGFVQWGRQRGCAEAHVDHYSDNTAAGEFYGQAGFKPMSVSRALAL